VTEGALASAKVPGIDVVSAEIAKRHTVGSQSCRRRKRRRRAIVLFDLFR
jgi:hypothetical protein